MHPVLFRIGSFEIGAYGPMIVLGLVVALALGVRRARTLGIPSEFCFDLAFVALLSGFLGARLFFILLNLELFFESPLRLLFSRTGFVFMGGLVAASLTSLIFIRKRGVALWDTADLAAPSLAVAHAFGRIGCFFAGCCYGRVCSPDNPIGVTFPHLFNEKGDTIFSFAFVDHYLNHRDLIDLTAARSLPVIPTQLLESAANFLICGALLLLWRRRRFGGQIFIFYLVFYGFVRFALEYLRGDLERGVYFDGLLSTSQLFSLAAVIVAAILWVCLRPGSPLARPKPAHGK